MKSEEKEKRLKMMAVYTLHSNGFSFRDITKLLNYASTNSIVKLLKEYEKDFM